MSKHTVSTRTKTFQRQFNGILRDRKKPTYQDKMNALAELLAGVGEMSKAEMDQTVALVLLMLASDYEESVFLDFVHAMKAICQVKFEFRSKRVPDEILYNFYLDAKEGKDLSDEGASSQIKDAFLTAMSQIMITHGKYHDCAADSDEGSDSDYKDETPVRKKPRSVPKKAAATETVRSPLIIAPTASLTLGSPVAFIPVPPEQVDALAALFALSKSPTPVTRGATLLSPATAFADAHGLGSAGSAHQGLGLPPFPEVDLSL